MPDLPSSFSGEIGALRRLVQLSSGSPSFAFALCNQPTLRREIISQVRSPQIAVADLPDDTVDPVAKARELIPMGHQGAVFITGLDYLLSEALEVSTEHIARLNRSRERWRTSFPSQLLVFWLSEQALLRILREAPDFRAWVSHELDFTEPASVLSPESRHTPLRSADATARAAAITARLSQEEDLPPLHRLSLIRELLRLAPASTEAAILAENGIHTSLQKLRSRASDKGDSYSLRDLMIALHDVAGSYLELGDSQSAGRYYQEAHAISERLAGSDPANALWQRDLSVSLERLGNLAVAQGDLAAARDSFTRYRDIAERLAASDPANALWQRDLSVSLNQLGNLAMAQGDLAAARDSFTRYRDIAERLAASDPANALWQRDLSISLERLGDLAVAQGDLAAARDFFTRSRDIAERLAASDTANAQWQRDLSISLGKLGDLAVAQGDLAAARDSFTRYRDIAERLAASDPANALWQRDLWVSYWRQADLCEKSLKPDEARAWWKKAHDTLASMKARGLHVSPKDLKVLEELKAKVAEEGPGAGEAAAAG